MKLARLDIKAFIRELLFGYDCVIIPGFGGFIGNHSPARIDRTTGTFKPPVKLITFNRNLDHNDGLLVGRISLAAGLNYGDSRHLVEDFVRDIKSRLSRGERVVFDHLGFFYLNHENSIQFEPESDINYCLDSYGLESFNLGYRKDYDVRKRILRHIDKDPVKSSSLRRNLVRAAIMIPIIALLVIVPLKNQYTHKSTIETVTLNPLVTAEFENNRSAIDSSLDFSTERKEESLAKPTENTNVEEQTDVQPDIQPSLTTVPATGESNYYIITGSFKSEENAMLHVQALKEEGFEPEIIKASNGFYRVNAMTCNSMDKAVTKKDSLSRKFPGVWITKKKPI